MQRFKYHQFKSPPAFYTCSGPQCPVVNPSQCVSYWWRNLLNINNLFPEKEMCAAWSWYLANDFQFFCLSPVFLILLLTIPPLAWVRRWTLHDYYSLRRLLSTSHTLSPLITNSSSFAVCIKHMVCLAKNLDEYF